MRSKTHPGFWDAYYQLPKTIQIKAAVTYKRWRKIRINRGFPLNQ